MEAQEEAKGLVGALLDFSFTSFATTKIIKFLYGLGIPLAVLFGAFVLLGGITQGALAGLGALILVPLVFLLYVMYLRVVLEVLVVVFRIAEHTGQIAARSRT